MHLRPYRPPDLPALLDLFYQTVHTVCSRDYTAAQLDAWAPAAPDTAAWREKLGRGTTLVAEEAGVILGFGTVLPDGYMDLLYVRRSHQRRGVGTALCDFLEFQYPAERLTVHASKTARPFFEHQGFRLLCPQQVMRQGQTLTNYIMEKEMC